MLLQQIKAYLKQRHIVSLLDLKKEFGADSDVLRDMLNLWIQKGQVRCLQKTPACGTRCTNCDPLFTEMYEWISTTRPQAREDIIHFKVHS
jgi:hypothetical protein